jgi:glycerate 2-kinase
MSATKILNPIDFLMDLYRSMLDAANPLKVLPKHLPSPPKGRTVVVGMGKAAACMAQALETHWSDDLHGVVVVPQGGSLPLKKIKVLESSHPIPDANSVKAANNIMQAVSNLNGDDLVIALISGGGSSLCSLPIDGLSLEEKQHITNALLKRGASISEINTVRKHLSAIKGGRLAAAAYPAKVVTLLISDIPGDDPALIASGPTLGDSSTCGEAASVLKRYAINTQDVIHESLASGLWESVKPNDPNLENNTVTIIATARDGLNAAGSMSLKKNVPCHILSDSMEGEARDLAKAHAAIALSIAQNNTPFQAPCVIISGGEATVTVRGRGRGGRNTEFALAFAMAIDGKTGCDRIYALSAGTDGLDGQALAAGAWVSPDCLSTIYGQGLHPQEFLDANDSASLFNNLGSLIHTGPTHTNINDFRAIFIDK